MRGRALGKPRIAARSAARRISSRETGRGDVWASLPNSTLWLTGILVALHRRQHAAIARILEPAIVTLGVFYVIVWGYLQLIGKIEEPFIEGAKRL